MFKHDWTNLPAGRTWLAWRPGAYRAVPRFVPPTTTDGAQRPKPLIVQWYHDQSMAEGVRVQIVMPVSVADALKARAQAEKRTVSSLGCYLVENGLRNLPPLPNSEK